jgi:uncharacterized protein (TIGR02001 family)
MLNKKFIAAAIAAAFAVPGVSVAQEAASPLTGNLTFTTDYVFRGITQTFEQPAIQGGFDYAHSSGLYLGTWGSNVSGLQYTDGSMEWDFYGGWTKSFGDFGLNVGAIYYYYPGAEISPAGESYDTGEIYIGGSWKWFSAKLYYTVTDFFGLNTTTGGSDSSDGSTYLDLSVSYPLPQGFTVGAHYGIQSVEGAPTGVDLDYNDYKISVSKDVKGYLFTLAFTDTDIEASNIAPIPNTQGDTVQPGDSRVFLSVTKTF